MTATDIKIVLNRLNTFGDEVFGDPNVLKSYFYAISDFAVGARYVDNLLANQFSNRFMSTDKWVTRMCLLTSWVAKLKPHPAYC